MAYMSCKAFAPVGSMIVSNTQGIVVVGVLIRARGLWRADDSSSSSSKA
jgi:hypothetical protein